MKKILFIAAFIWCATMQASGREISLSASADRLFTDSAYHSIIKTQCKRAALQKGIAESNFDSNYEVLENEILLAATELLQKKFSETEKRLSKKPPPEKIQIQLFENAIFNALTVTLNQHKELQEALARTDLNDRILSFDSRITLQKDGRIHVVETISIANFNEDAAGINNSIKRGITRDFPTRYTNSVGLNTSVPFELISISRNGQKENFKTENLSNGIRVYCGRSDHFLEEGKHTYVIEYSTANQLKYFPDRDEFYWNVTGNGWSFSIDRADAEISFPEGTNLSNINCYSGTQGSKDKHCDYSDKTNRSIHFHTAKKLAPFEGLTISVSAQKGIFTENKSQYDQLISLLKDNIFIVSLFSFVVLLSLTLFRYWLRVGRDPKSGIIIPAFAPPAGLSPAATGFLYQQEYSDKLLTAAIIDLAVKKKLHIEVDREGLIFKTNVYRFSAPPQTAQETDERDYPLYEQYGFDASDLFGIEIEKGKYNAGFASVRNRFRIKMDDLLLSDNQNKKTKGYLSMNSSAIGIGLVLLIFISIGSAVYCGVTDPPIPTLIYATVILLIGFIVQIIFMKIIKALTPEGRRITDEILGFRMYLDTAEKNELDLMNPPENNIQLYEKYLPYAIALGVENRWSEKFKTVIERALAEGYSPSYYSLSNHSSFSGSQQSFAAAFSSGLSGSVSSASTPPSSSGSSGSGGGGFSGGGGGGGGGGGW